MIQLIIFDYGRTLYDRESSQLFPEVHALIPALASKYQLAIVSVSSSADEQKRINLLKEHGLLEYFASIQFTPNPAEKFALYNTLLKQLQRKPPQVAVVDDYIVRGVAWGNRVGATTVWFRNGKFSHILPTDETGQPDYAIRSLSELNDIFLA